MSERVLTIWQTAALECLERAIRRDLVKGGGGFRTTREVADYVGITVTQARSTLYALSGMDLIDCYDEKPLTWKITPAGVAAFAATKPGGTP